MSAPAVEVLERDPEGRTIAVRVEVVRGGNPIGRTPRVREAVTIRVGDVFEAKGGRRGGSGSITSRLATEYPRRWRS